MAAPNVRSSSFSRNISVVSSPQIPGLKCGPNGTTFISTGIRDLDSEIPSYLLIKSMIEFLVLVVKVLSFTILFRDTRWWVSFGKLSNGDGRS